MKPLGVEQLYYTCMQYNTYYNTQVSIQYMIQCMLYRKINNLSEWHNTRMQLSLIFTKNICLSTLPGLNLIVAAEAVRSSMGVIAGRVGAGTDCIQWDICCIVNCIMGKRFSAHRTNGVFASPIKDTPNNVMTLIKMLQRHYDGEMSVKDVNFIWYI